MDWEGGRAEFNNVILFHSAPRLLLKVMLPSNLFRLFLDRFGAAGSLLCAIHCALLPALLALAPSLGLSFWLSDGLERAVVVFVTFLGLFSLIWATAVIAQCMRWRC